MRAPTCRLRDGATLLLLTVVAALFWWYRIIATATREDLAGFDHFGQIYPMAYRAAERLLAGDLPLWNPYQYAGHPFLATSLYGVLYPPNVLFLLLRTEVAIEALAVLHLAAAGGFTFLYGRAIGLGWAGAVAAGLTFMLSGFMVSQAQWFSPAIASAAWLPLGFLAIDRLFAERRWRWVVLLAVAVAMPLLAGWAQTWAYTLYALAAYAAVRVVACALRAEGRPGLPRACVLAFAGFTLGMCLVAAQLLPSVELQRLGPRRAGALSVLQIIPFGAEAPGKTLSALVDSTPGMPRFAYLGVVALLLAPFSLAARRQRLRTTFLLVLALLTLAVTLTVFTPIFDLYLRLPPFGSFRIPQRILFLFAFAGAMLSGIGLDTIARVPATDAAPRRAWLVLVALVVGLTLILAVPMPLWSQRCIGIVLVLVLGVALLRGAARGVLVAGLLALLAADLFHASANDALHPFNDRRAFDREAQALDYVRRNQGLFRTFIDNPRVIDAASMEKQGTLRRIYSITDYEPLSVGRYERFFALLKPWTAPSLYTFTGHLVLLPAPRNLRMLDLLSVRFIATHWNAAAIRRAVSQTGWRSTGVMVPGQYVVWENPAPLPRAYVAHVPVAAADEAAALRAIADPSFDARRSVVLEGVPATDAAADGEGAIVEATIAEYEAERVVVDTDDARPGHLVLTDTFYPGWFASIDGQAAPIVRANYLFRAVRVPAGRHRVVFEYRPWSFRLGATITLVALGVLVVGLVADVRTSPAREVATG